MQIDEILEYYSKEYCIPGIIAAEGTAQQVEIYTHGYEDAGKKIGISENSLFEIASLSKAFTALLILLYEEKKVLSLDSVISKYLDGLHICLKDTGEDVTDSIRIRDLVYHTTGYSVNSIVLSSGKKHNNYEKIISQINREHLVSRPGEKYGYSSMNYILLQLIIEKISGKCFADEIEEMIFKPLGLENTSADYEKALKSGRMVGGNKLAFLKPRPAKLIDHTYEAAGGYIFSTMKDMIRWAGIQLGQVQDIPEEYKRVIEKSHEKKSDRQINDVSYYAAGWVVYPREKKMIHTGNNPLFSSMIEIRPEKGSFIILMLNVNTILVERMVKSIRKKDISGKTSKMSFLNSKIDLLNVLMLIPEIVWILGILKQDLLAGILMNILFGTILAIHVFQYLFCRVIKKYRIKLLFEWGPGSLYWSYGIFCVAIIAYIVKGIFC